MKAARVLAGLTQRELAELVKCNEITISRIETGRIVPESELKTEIAKVLGIRTWEVVA